MIDMILSNPGFIIILAGVLCALIPVNQVRKAILLLAPIVAGYMIFTATKDMEAARFAAFADVDDSNLLRPPAAFAAAHATPDRVDAATLAVAADQLRNVELSHPSTIRADGV